jgi:hypothetical protein
MSVSPYGDAILPYQSSWLMLLATNKPNSTGQPGCPACTADPRQMRMRIGCEHKHQRYIIEDQAAASHGSLSITRCAQKPEASLRPSALSQPDGTSVLAYLEEFSRAEQILLQHIPRGMHPLPAFATGTEYTHGSNKRSSCNGQVQRNIRNDVCHLAAGSCNCSCGTPLLTMS